MSVLVRDAQESDIPGLTACLPLAHARGSEGWRDWSDPALVAVVLRCPSTVRGRGIRFTVRVAEAQGAVAAAIVHRIAYDRLGSTDAVFTDIGLIDALAVLPDHRRAGLGRTLIADAESSWRKAGVRVAYAEASGGSHDFYRACGYQVESVEAEVLTFFPRQGGRTYSHHRDEVDPQARLVWRSMTEGRTRSTPYRGRGRWGGRGVGSHSRGRAPGRPRVEGAFTGVMGR